jgi:hypothetical protein
MRRELLSGAIAQRIAPYLPARSKGRNTLRYLFRSADYAAFTFFLRKKVR